MSQLDAWRRYRLAGRIWRGKETHDGSFPSRLIEFAVDTRIRYQGDWIQNGALNPRRVAPQALGGRLRWPARAEANRRKRIKRQRASNAYAVAGDLRPSHETASQAMASGSNDA